MDETEARQRMDALEMALKGAHNAPQPDEVTIERAQKFYAFLSGAEPAVPSGSTYSITVNNPITPSPHNHF